MNLTILLDMAVEGFGDRPVTGSGDTIFTAEDIYNMADAGARAISDAEADALIYLAVNGPAFPVALFSAARAGVPLVPVNYRLGHEQLESLLANHPRAIAIADPAQRNLVERAGIATRTPQEWLEQRTNDPVTPPSEPTAPAVIIYTSGTTSTPKGVLLRHENLTSYVLNSVEFASALPEEAALVSVPPYHIAAVANTITNLYAGRRVVALQQFAPDAWMETVRREGITNALIVPTMLARLVESDGDKAMPTLRNLAYGGAPMPTSIIERALSLWPEVGFVNGYGLTETSSTVAVLSPEDHRSAMESEDADVRRRLSSVGKPLPGIDIQIRDLDGKALPAGQVGTIHVRAAQVSAEYAGIGKVVDDEGFFDTRDEGYLDAEGYLFIGGRVDDTIIRGAENIAPAEIEDVLLRHPAVVDAVAVGVPDEEWGQRVEAVVVLRDDTELDTEDLRRFTRELLRTSKTPDRIEIWSEIPRTETGKLLRRNVAQMLTSPSEPAGRS